MDYDPKAEEGRVKGLIGSALAKVKEAMESPIWSYTREFELGMLDVAKAILGGLLSQETDIEKLLKSDKLKVLKPNECGIVYDEKAGVLLGLYNKDGELKTRKIKV